jgi:hypothetical protein
MYNNNDTLAGTKDFQMLFELLNKHKDNNGTKFNLNVSKYLQ